LLERVAEIAEAEFDIKAERVLQEIAAVATTPRISSSGASMRTCFR
jgi:hypothetical protein